MGRRKRILLATFGTLGDIYPFIAIAHAVRRRDLDVVIAAPEMHRGSIERERIAYAPCDHTRTTLSTRSMLISPVLSTSC